MKTLKRITLGLLLLFAGFGITALGVLTFVQYSWPMHKGNYERASERLALGSRSDALYNGALVYKNDHNPAMAVKLGLSAYNELLSGSSGTIPPNQLAFAAEIQFLLGNCLKDTNKVPEAIAAYETCLRLMPDHRDRRQEEIVISAQRNLQWLKNATGGGGSGNSKQNPGPGPGQKGDI